MIDNPYLLAFRDQWEVVGPTMPAAARAFIDAIDANPARKADPDAISARVTLAFIAVIPDHGAGACRYDTLTWQDQPGVDGPVLICDTHRWAAGGTAYDGDPEHPTGPCTMFSDVRLPQPVTAPRA